MSDEITALARRVATISSAADADAVLAVMNDVEVLQKRAKEVKHQLEQALIAYIDEHGEIEAGDVRWYVGIDKTYKPAVPLPQLVENLLAVTEGDFDRFCELLSSGAFKPGACKSVLGDGFDAAFETIVKRNLETGKPRRSLKSVDKRFTK